MKQQQQQHNSGYARGSEGRVLQGTAAIVQDLKARIELAQLEQASVHAVSKKADSRFQHMQRQLGNAVNKHAADAQQVQQLQHAKTKQEEEVQWMREQLSAMKQQCLVQLNDLQQQLNAAHMQREGVKSAPQLQDTARQHFTAMQSALRTAEQQKHDAEQQHRLELQQLHEEFYRTQNLTAQQSGDDIKNLQGMLAKAQRQRDADQAVKQQQALQLQLLQEQLDTAVAKLAQKQQQPHQPVVVEQHAQAKLGSAAQSGLQPLQQQQQLRMQSVMQQSTAQVLQYPAPVQHSVEQHASAAEKHLGSYSSSAAVQGFQLMAEANASLCSSAMAQKEDPHAECVMVLTAAHAKVSI